MDEQQRKALKKSFQSKQRKEELLKEAVKGKPRTMRLTATKNKKLAKKMLTLKVQLLVHRQIH